MDHAEAVELLGAFALDACEEPEASAVALHLEGCGGCAAEAGRLRRAAAWLGTMEARIPPPRVRDAVLAGIADRMMRASDDGPRALVHPGELYRTQVRNLRDTLHELEAGEWGSLASEADGWSVRDLVAHLSATDSLLAEALGLGSAAEPGDPADASGRTEAFVDRSRVGDPDATLPDWWEQASAIGRHVAALGDAELERPVLWFGLMLPLRRVLVGRAFEVWVHADDIRAVTGRPKRPPEGSEMHTIADLAVRSLPAALRVIGAEHPGATARIVLLGDGGGEWTLPLERGLEAGVPRVTLTADVLSFCSLAGGRMRPEDLDVAFEGDAGLGRDLVRAAPAFAGP